jgi:hypothetical protein
MVYVFMRQRDIGLFYRSLFIPMIPENMPKNMCRLNLFTCVQLKYICMITTVK